jgi:hypothetical protein
MKKPAVLHPFLFALFPVLFGYAHNVRNTPCRWVWLPMAAALALALVVLALSAVLFRDRVKAGLFASLMLLFFFSYGRLFFALRSFRIFSGIGPHDILFISMAVLSIGTACLLLKTRKPLSAHTSAANLFSLALVVLSSVQIGVYWINPSRIGPRGGKTAPREQAAAGTVLPERLPDVYFIILDGYARQDVLRELYGFDNSAFTGWLEANGFYVAGNSRSNYCQTALSMASSLNYEYLDRSGDRIRLEKLIQDNRLFRVLRQAGYGITAVESDYSFANLRSADRFIATSRLVSNEFYDMLLRSSVMSFFIDRQASRDSASSPHEKRLRSAFDHLEKAPQLSRPQFFFAHILSPHPYTPGTAVPLADGSDYYYYTKKSSDQYRREYVSRLTALNENLRTLVGRILAKSGRPNVVILQADHGGGSEYDLESAAGTNLRERMSIFNALYLPEGGSRLAYAGMTPVNTFRIVLKKYLGLELELLEDRSYYSTWDAPFQFVEYAP